MKCSDGKFASQQPTDVSKLQFDQGIVDEEPLSEIIMIMIIIIIIIGYRNLGRKTKISLTGLARLLSIKH